MRPESAVSAQIAPEAQEDDDSDADIIELDAHGLRHPAQCVAMIIEDDEDDETRQSCTLCR